MFKQTIGIVTSMKHLEAKRYAIRLAACLALFMPLLAGMAALSPAQAQSNPRYAALVINSRTGDVLYNDSADAKRYPASLTKMMTLYMAFDALERGKFSLNTALKASANAARMPQTNISLRQGDTITVRQVIQCLVTRSANDAAVVMAESIGGTEWNFARLMTRKARELGMRSTVFQNASGLPDNRQHTTARDMATLGIALRRDFPQYYHFFTTKSCTYKGRTYHTHNNVIARYNGVDGIKTGYINASGFNLVTSVRKNGYDLVAVVMGGRTARSRDDHMIRLLDRTYAQLDKTGGTMLASAQPLKSAPVPQAHPLRQATTELAQAPELPSPSVASTEEIQVASLNTVVPGLRENTLMAPTASAPATVRTIATPLSQPKPVQEASLNPAAETSTENASVNTQSGSKNWGIQVGAFEEPKDALIAAAHAINLASNVLSNSKINVSDLQDGEKGIHRARLSNLSKEQAQQACSILVSQKESCFVYQQ
jgi:D-alanyl-D-alanine carboxypeptidase